jgi:hypothetical protein
MVYRSRYLSMDDDIPRWIGTLMRFSLALYCLFRELLALPVEGNWRLLPR